MTGEERKCFNSDEPIVKNYWSSGFSIPGEKQYPGYTSDAGAAELQKLIAKYLTWTYYWYVELRTDAGDAY